MKPPRHRALGLLVLALHLGLGLSLHLALRRPPATPATPTRPGPVHVWISPPAARPEPPAPAPVRPSPAALRAAIPEPPALRTRPDREVAAQAITLPVPTAAAAASASPTATATTTTTTAATPATPSASAPLNLALPARPASAPLPSGWARDDPRVHSPPLNGDERMARALGTDTTLRTVRRGDGFELRRGNGCVQVQPSRAGQILPADSSAPRPSLVGSC
ncbi:hypothetical protein AACH10_01275 [Ideonella sp. DXS22W]|uniref:Uncharacterized protein n=1 Tax=Pseudaquabacterium inlustre TaxID=2984192 RepID=A0ABU9CAI6_9BURK